MQYILQLSSTFFVFCPLLNGESVYYHQTTCAYEKKSKAFFSPLSVLIAPGRHEELSFWKAWIKKKRVSLLKVIHLDQKSLPADVTLLEREWNGMPRNYIRRRCLCICGCTGVTCEKNYSFKDLFYVVENYTFLSRFVAVCVCAATVKVVVLKMSQLTPCAITSYFSLSV